MTLTLTVDNFQTLHVCACANKLTKFTFFYVFLAAFRESLVCRFTRKKIMMKKEVEEYTSVLATYKAHNTTSVLIRNMFTIFNSFMLTTFYCFGPINTLEKHSSNRFLHMPQQRYLQKLFKTSFFNSSGFIMFSAEIR